jgi:hypothetical protein
MNVLAQCCAILFCLPLVAQGPPDPGSPDLRVDSASLGIGYGTQGFMLTTMWTGPTFGYFGGFAVLPDTSSPSMTEPGNGSARWVQHKSSTGEGHLGLAYRLDSRWVIGLGVGYSSTQYRYTYNPGSSPFPLATAPPSPGPPSDSTVGLVAMVDVRLGRAWGVQVVGGNIGLGGAITFRF